MKSLIVSTLILGLVGLVVGVAVEGATEGSVSATVTVQSISVAVADGTVAYGTLAVNTSKDTTSGGINNTQVATNNGNVNETLSIKGFASSPAGWVLAGTTDANQYKHEFCKTGTGVPDPCDTSPTYTALTTSYQNLATPVVPTGTQRFDLKITTPTSSTSFEVQSVNVTILAAIAP